VFEIVIASQRLARMRADDRLREAIQKAAKQNWIASFAALLATTTLPVELLSALFCQ
jgi:hypothetical protein